MDSCPFSAKSRETRESLDYARRSANLSEMLKKRVEVVQRRRGVEYVTLKWEKAALN